MLCRYISSYDPPLVDYIYFFFTLVQRYIYRRCFLRNSQRDIFNLPLDILNIPIISLDFYKEKNRNLHKISWAKNLTESVTNIWDYTGGFCKFKCNLWKFRKLKLSISQVEFVISQLGGDFATWRWFHNLIHSWKNGIWTCKVAHVCLQVVSQLQNFRKLILQLRNFSLAWCDCLQMAITSLFQLRFAHRLKRWTYNFLSFEIIYSMYKMNSRKCSKCVLQMLSSWISSC